MEFDAAVLARTGAPLMIERVTLAPLRPSDVLIRNRASGLCHTDLEVIEGSLAYPLPIVLGHEGAGIVEAVGGAVTQVRPGDHVVASWNPHCGDCFYCDRDLPILCEPFTREQPRGHLLDGASRLSLGGAPLHHFSVVSSHAEYSVVPESGASIDSVRAATAGRGADHVFECAGAEASLQLALEITRPGGQLVILGKTAVNRHISLRFGSLMGEKRIVRSSYGGARPRRDFPWLAQLYLDGKLDLDTLVSGRMPLARINEGFDAMREGRGVRHVVVFCD